MEKASSASFAALLNVLSFGLLVPLLLASRLLASPFYLLSRSSQLCSTRLL